MDPDGRLSRCGISCDDEREDLRKRDVQLPKSGSPALPHATTVASRSDLPEVGDSEGSSDTGGFTGFVEGWEKERELIGEGVVWATVPEEDWYTLPLGGLKGVLRPKKPGGGSIDIPLFRAPDLQIARQRGEYTLYRQIGWRHVVDFYDNGVRTFQADKPRGHGVIWTQETKLEPRGITTTQFDWRISY